MYLLDNDDDEEGVSQSFIGSLKTKFASMAAKKAKGQAMSAAKNQAKSMLGGGGGAGAESSGAKGESGRSVRPGQYFSSDSGRSGLTVLFWALLTYIWIKCLGFSPKLSEQNALGDTGLRAIQAFRVLGIQTKAFFVGIFRLVVLLGKTILNFFFMSLRIYVYILITLLILYLIQAYWETTLAFIIKIVIPILNLLIFIFNFFLQLFIMIARILIQIWNMLVPFIGIILFVVIDLAVSIMKIVFEVLGAINIMEILGSLFEVLFVLIDIAMQILMVLIQVGMAVLEVVAAVISFVMELIMIVFKVLVNILVWILDLLFPILKPILFIIQAIALAFSWMTVAKTAGMMLMSRKLLTLGISGLMLSPSGKFVDMEEEMTSPLEEPFEEEHEGNIYFSDITSRFNNLLNHADTPQHLKDGFDIGFDNPKASRDFAKEEAERMKRVTSTENNPYFYNNDNEEGGYGDWMQSVASGAYRSLLQASDSAFDSNTQSTLSTMDHIARGFHQGVSDVMRDKSLDINLAIDHYSTIMAHREELKDHHAFQNVYARYVAANPRYAHENRQLKYAKYFDDKDHPRRMAVKMEEKQAAYAEKHGISRSARQWMKSKGVTSATNAATGRSLLNHPVGARQWDGSKDLHHQYLAEMEREDAKTLANYQQEFTDHQHKRFKIAHAVGHGFRTTFNKHTHGMLHPKVWADHGTRMINQYGYDSPWEIYHDFVEQHGDAASFIASFSKTMWDWRPMSLLRKIPGSMMEESHFFHNWQEEQDKYDEAHHSRNILQSTERDQAPGAGTSKEKFSTLELLAKTDCYSIPKNPLCIWEIPEDFEPQLPEIVVPRDVTADGAYCSPWRETRCILCLDRFLNFFQSVRFIISGNPLTNFPLALLQMIVPPVWIFTWWVWLVEPGELASFQQVTCFVKHLYDLVIVGLFLWVVVPFMFEFFDWLWKVIQECYFIPREMELGVQEYWQSERENDNALEMGFASAIAYQERSLRKVQKRSEDRKRMNELMSTYGLRGDVPQGNFIGEQYNVTNIHYHAASLTREQAFAEFVRRMQDVVRSSTNDAAQMRSFINRMIFDHNQQFVTMIDSQNERESQNVMAELVGNNHPLLLDHRPSTDENDEEKGNAGNSRDPYV